MGCSSSPPYEISVSSPSGTVTHTIYRNKDVDGIADDILSTIESGKMLVTSNGQFPAIAAAKITSEPLNMDVPKGVDIPSVTTIKSGNFVLHSPAMAGDFDYSADVMTDNGWQTHCSGSKEYVIREVLRSIQATMESTIAPSNKAFEQNRQCAPFRFDRRHHE